MWIRAKRPNGRWGEWAWHQGLTRTLLMRARGAVQRVFREYVLACLQRGEHLCIPQSQHPRIKVPLGFTPNDMVRTVVESQERFKVDLLNSHCFFQSIQIACGDYETGPVHPFRRLRNVMSEPIGGWPTGNTTGGRGAHDVEGASGSSS